MTESSDAPRGREGRARPLPPEERRRAIIAAARPLIVAGGPNVSTREIAEAAGVAEGTLFRVFATKEAVIEAVIADATDPAEPCARITAISPDLALDERVRRVVTILRDRVRDVTGVFIALRLRPHPPEGEAEETRQERRRRHEQDSLKIREAIASVLAPDAANLRVDTAQAARFISAMALVTGHPMLHDPPGDDIGVVTDLLLHGLAEPASRSAMPPTDTMSPTEDVRC